MIMFGKRKNLKSYDNIDVKEEEAQQDPMEPEASADKEDPAAADPVEAQDADPEAALIGSEEAVKDVLDGEPDLLSEAGYEDFEDTLNATRALQSGLMQPETEDDDMLPDDMDEDDLENDLEEDDDDYDPNVRDSREGNFGDFLAETITKIRDGYQKNSRKSIIILCSAATGIVAVILILSFVGKKGAQDITGSLSANEPVTADADSSGTIAVPDAPLLLDAYPAVNELVLKFFEAKQKNDQETLLKIRNFSTLDLLKTEELSNYVEEYRDIKCYTKAGPFPDSYIAYVCYEVKIRDWDTTASSEITLLVCTNEEDGSLYIYSGEMDQNVADYIINISSQEDVVDLITRVNTRYKEVLDANPDFATYIAAMNQTIKENVGEQLAAAEVTVSDANIVEENVPDQGGVTETPAASENKVTEVKTTTTVNVRASDSEQADRLGKAEAGMVLTCKQQKKNGWTEVVFNGQTGYIKSDYLTPVGQTAPQDLPETHGTVTARDTVNIRSRADVNSERVGIAYGGESFGLVKKGSEWTEIIYNGQVAYVKTEYIE